MPSLLGLGLFSIVLTATCAGQTQPHSPHPKRITQPAKAARIPSLGETPEARDAVLALKKLQATVESGVSYRDYSTAMAEANFPLKLFLENEMSEKAAKFSRDLTASMQWYKAAREFWGIKIDTDFPEGYCEKGADRIQNEYGVPELCRAYPQLVTTQSEPRFVGTADAPIERDFKVILYTDAMQKALETAVLSC